MNPRIVSKLRDKGWSESEIEKMLSITNSANYAPQKELSLHKVLNPVVYWMALLLTVIGNFLVSIILIPFLVFLDRPVVYLIVVILGFVFGSMFTLILWEIEHVDPRHHIIAGAFIPAIAVITLYIMVQLANEISSSLKFGVFQNPVFVSLIYVSAFVLPYLFTLFRHNFRRRGTFFPW